MKAVYFLCGLALLVALFFMFAPADRVNFVVSFFQSSSPEQLLAEDCLKSVHIGRFNFPDTVEITDFRMVRPEPSARSPERIHLTVSAKNAFGVPARHELDCVVSWGRLDLEASRRERLSADFERLVQ